MPESWVVLRRRRERAPEKGEGELWRGEEVMRMSVGKRGEERVRRAEPKALLGRKGCEGRSGMVVVDRREFETDVRNPCSVLESGFYACVKRRVCAVHVNEDFMTFRPRFARVVPKGLPHLSHNTPKNKLQTEATIQTL